MYITPRSSLQDVTCPTSWKVEGVENIIFLLNVTSLDGQENICSERCSVW